MFYSSQNIEQIEQEHKSDKIGHGAYRLERKLRTSKIARFMIGLTAIGMVPLGAATFKNLSETAPVVEETRANSEKGEKAKAAFSDHIDQLESAQKDIAAEENLMLTPNQAAQDQERRLNVLSGRMDATVQNILLNPHITAVHFSELQAGVKDSTLFAADADGLNATFSALSGKGLAHCQKTPLKYLHESGDENNAARDVAGCMYNIDHPEAKETALMLIGGFLGGTAAFMFLMLAGGMLESRAWHYEFRGRAIKWRKEYSERANCFAKEHQLEKHSRDNLDAWIKSAKAPRPVIANKDNAHLVTWLQSDKAAIRKNAGPGH